MDICLRDLLCEAEGETLLLLLGEVEGAVLESALEGEHVDVCGPVARGHHHHVALLVQPEHQGQLVDVAHRGEGVRHRHQTWGTTG